MGKRLSDDALHRRYPPSPPCDCRVCRSYCRRPGWWTVEEARRVMDAGYGRRMMLEVSANGSIVVLSPAFRGCEGGFALQSYSSYGCNFLRKGLCELHDTGFMPLECRFCHHERQGQGTACHLDLENDWHTPAGRDLVARWISATGLRISFRDILPGL